MLLRIETLLLLLLLLLLCLSFSQYTKLVGVSMSFSEELLEDMCDWDGNQMHNCTFCGYVGYSEVPNISPNEYLRWELLPNRLRGNLCPVCDKMQISFLYNKSALLRFRLAVYSIVRKIWRYIKKCSV